MTIAEAISKIERVKETHLVGGEGYSEESLYYILNHNDKNLHIHQCGSSKWMVTIDSECVSIARTLKAAKEVGAYYLLK